MPTIHTEEIMLGSPRIRTFAEFPWHLYKNHPLWTPPLRGDLTGNKVLSLTGLLTPEHPVVSIIVDLRARRVCTVLSGTLDDGGTRRAGGVSRLPPGFSSAPLTELEMAASPAVERIRFWRRPLLIAETLAAQAQPHH